MGSLHFNMLGGVDCMIMRLSVAIPVDSDSPDGRGSSQSHTLTQIELNELSRFRNGGV